MDGVRENMNKAIEEICKEFNITYVEIINVVDFRKWTCGKIEELPYKGLYLNLLGDENKIRNLIGMFETDTEPQTWKQGKLTLLVFKKQMNLVCMFYITEKKGVESLEYSKSIFLRYSKIGNAPYLE